MRVHQRAIMATMGCLAACLIATAALATEADPPSGHLVKDFGADLQSLFSSENAAWLIGGSLATWGAYEIEDPDGARRALDQGIIDPLVDSGNTYADIRVQAPLALLVWGYGHWRDQPTTRAVGYDLIRAVSLNYVMVGAMKPAFDRTRPNGDSYSFPSGHTSTAFAAAGVISRHAGRWWSTAAVGAGVLTGLGRMEDHKHYASDVVAGATIGWIVGRSVARRRSQDSDASTWNVSPMPGGALLSCSF